MWLIKLVITIFLALSSMSSFAKAQSTSLDNIAACVGIVIGNASADFILGDEQSFDEQINIAYTAYLSEIFSGEYPESDLQLADIILGANTDKIINAVNSGTFTTDTYEEVIVCYRALGQQLIEKAETILNYQTNWNEIKNNQIEIIKRVLQAG